MRLAEMQELFWRLITAPDGPAAAGVPLETIAELCHGDARFPPLERMEVYADAYFWRIHDALAEDFPNLRRAAGERVWHNLIVGYLAACPSRDPDLGRIGARLPAWMRDREGWLADLAALEWARVEAFVAAGAEPISADALRGIDPERFATARFILVPSATLLELASRADLVWRAIEDGGDPQEPALGPIAVRVWRQEFTVYHQAIGRAEAAALERVLAGRTLAEVCQVFRTSQEAFQALGSWVQDGLVSRLAAPG